jgi:hypothetical protein
MVRAAWEWSNSQGFPMDLKVIPVSVTLLSHVVDWTSAGRRSGRVVTEDKDGVGGVGGRI